MVELVAAHQNWLEVFIVTHPWWSVGLYVLVGFAFAVVPRVFDMWSFSDGPPAVVWLLLWPVAVFIGGLMLVVLGCEHAAEFTADWIRERLHSWR